jgi:hypothetical protein
MEPRCRWRIGLGIGLEPGLAPYRLLVSLIENKRVNGKVQQEHIADLGAVDGHMLPAFYAGVVPEILSVVLGGPAGIERWYRASVRMRADFWQHVNETLARLANRIDVEAANKIREAIALRVPMLTAQEHEALPKWDTEEEVAGWRSQKEWWDHLVASTQKEIACDEASIAEKRQGLALLKATTDGVAKIVGRVEQDGPAGFHEAYRRINAALGNILLRRARTG